MNKPEPIQQIKLYRCPVRLKEPFIISLGKLEYADNIIVVIRTSGGITGFGERSPFQTIHGENGDTCMAVGKILAETIRGENALDIENCSSVMDAVIYGNTSVKSAFDMALYDIAGQKAGIPLYRFLGGENNKELVTDYTISVGSAEKMAADAGDTRRSAYLLERYLALALEHADVCRRRLCGVRGELPRLERLGPEIRLVDQRRLGPARTR